MADADIYSRRFRLNLKKKSHMTVYQILNEAECSGNQLIVDAILYYHEHMIEKKVSSTEQLRNEANVEKTSDEVEPDFAYFDIGQVVSKGN